MTSESIEQSYKRKRRTKYELTPQQVKLRRWLDIPVFVAAVLTIPVMIVETGDFPNGWKVAAQVGNWIIWIVFLVDLVAMTSIASKKRSYLIAAWLDLLIVLTSFPPITTLGILRLARLGRLGPVLRLLRLARLAAVITRGSDAAKKIFGKRGFAYVGAVAFFLVVGFAVAAVLIDPDIESMEEGLWWAVATITTVGYGDLTPTSSMGRLTAAILMFVGIGVVAVVTGLVASSMLDPSEEDAEIEARLDRIEARLDQLLEASNTEYPDGGDQTSLPNP